MRDYITILFFLGVVKPVALGRLCDESKLNAGNYTDFLIQLYPLTYFRSASYFLPEQ